MLAVAAVLVVAGAVLVTALVAPVRTAQRAAAARRMDAAALGRFSSALTAIHDIDLLWFVHQLGPGVPTADRDAVAARSSEAARSWLAAFPGGDAAETAFATSLAGTGPADVDRIAPAFLAWADALARQLDDPDLVTLATASLTLTGAVLPPPPDAPDDDVVRFAQGSPGLARLLLGDGSGPAPAPALVAGVDHLVASADGAALDALLRHDTAPVAAPTLLALTDRVGAAFTALVAAQVEAQRSSVLADAGAARRRAGHLTLLAGLGAVHVVAGLALGAVQWRRQRRRLVELNRHATTDPLTGLLNRRGAESAMRAALARPPVALLLIDVDHFKLVNDAHGHLAGDRVLAHVGRCLGAATRPADSIVSRWAGDEFVALLVDPTGRGEAATVVTRRFLDLLATPVAAESGTITVAASIGVALCSCGTCALDDLLARADVSLYEAKQSGRARAGAMRPCPPERVPVPVG